MHLTVAQALNFACTLGGIGLIYWMIVYGVTYRYYVKKAREVEAEYDRRLRKVRTDSE